MALTAPPGVFDILPLDAKEPWRSSYLWQHVKQQIRSIAHVYGFREIVTPLFERTELFKRGIGEDTDVVSKEMYTFEDKGGRFLTLRPEGTAPVLRAFIEHGLHQQAPIHKLYYVGTPMFRYERSQAGRYRQHHQFGAEAIGSESPELDVELIDLLCTVYRKLGLRDLKLAINTLGDTHCRAKYRSALLDHFGACKHALSEDSQRRLETNPLRILDSKDPRDKQWVQTAPRIDAYLNSACHDHFQCVQKLLGELSIPFSIEARLVRGLDYYNRTVFEIAAGELGAQNSIGGGGRYDGLLKMLGGPNLPAMGFGTGIERLIQTMLKQNIAPQAPSGPFIFIIPLGAAARKHAFTWMHRWRQCGLSVDMSLSEKKVGKELQYANQMQACWALVIGDDELRQEAVEFKHLATGTKKKIAIENLHGDPLNLCKHLHICS